MHEILFSLKSLIAISISSVVALFSPVKDMMVGMCVLFTLNFVVGTIADQFVLRLKRRQMLQKWAWYVLQCGLYFFVIFSLFAVGRLCHRDYESITCVNVISVITIWVFAISVLKGFKLLLPTDGTMYKFADVMLWIVSVKIVERIPYIAEYLHARHLESLDEIADKTAEHYEQKNKDKHKG